MTVISQDDHLTVGAWAACGIICNLKRKKKIVKGLKKIVTIILLLKIIKISV